jgi:hypothetical protein
MKSRIWGLAIALAAVALLVFVHGMRRPELVAASGGHPILVELFTSEGCSSCPPADDLLAQIEQKIPNAVVLSEHVTYWNNGGWHDPFSLDASTDRQSDYVQHMGLSSNYTPQMVVNGTREFTGSDGHAAAQAIALASDQPGVAVHITDVKTGEDRKVAFSVDTGEVQSSAQLLIVVAQDEGTKHVSNGENGGHTLRHVMIARSFTQAAKIKKGASYAGQMTVALPEAISGGGWHIVAFVEQGRGGPVLGVASAAVAEATAQAVSRGE